MAAAGAAVVFYFYSQRGNRNLLSWYGGGGEALRGFEANPARFSNAHQAPSTWMEALYFFAEALRCDLKGQCAAHLQRRGALRSAYMCRLMILMILDWRVLVD